MWILYQFVVAVLLLLAGPILLLVRGRHYLPTVRGRLGLGLDAWTAAPLWIHAVSVGEVGVARSLVDALPQDAAVLLTTVTPTGQEQARALLRPRLRTAYLPFELGWPIRRFLRRLEPRALVLCEGDYWPLLLRHVERRGLPVVVVNGRVSDASFRRMRRLRPLLGPLFDPVDAFGVQSEEDRRRLLELGVEPSRVEITGNMKFDAAQPQRDAALEARLQEVAAGRAILIAGSTMPGEEESVLRAFRRLGGAERALLVVAPRHPERWDSVEALLQSEIPSTVRRSRIDSAGPADVVLLDSMGELAGLYGICRSAFIGGTLVDTGGHNPLEPARYGVAIVAGPSMGNFRPIADEFTANGAWERVRDADGLAAIWTRWLSDPQSAAECGARAAELVHRNKGALERTVNLIEATLGEAPSTEAGAR